jgi:hypothetical protein
VIVGDAFGVHGALTRPPARAPQGPRAAGWERVERGTQLSALSALGRRGVVAPRVSEGAVAQLVVEPDVASRLVPPLLPKERVRVDNLSFPYSPRARSLLEAAGAQVEHCPAYSPDCKPLAACSSKLKATLRKLKAETERALLTSLAFALDQISSSDILGWFKHCGYHT